MRCASAIGSGMSSGVSRQANPNIIPWSPGSPAPPAIHAARDVRRLLLDADEGAAGLVVEPVVGPRVADVADGLADHRLKVHVGRRRDLAEDRDETCRRGRLAGDAGVRVLAEDRVEDGVRDLIAHLVGVTLGHGLRREQVAGSVDDAGHGVPERSTGAVCCACPPQAPARRRRLRRPGRCRAQARAARAGCRGPGCPALRRSGPAWRWAGRRRERRPRRVPPGSPPASPSPRRCTASPRSAGRGSWRAGRRPTRVSSGDAGPG